MAMRLKTSAFTLAGAIFVLLLCSFQDPSKHNEALKFSAIVEKDTSAASEGSKSPNLLTIRTMLINTTDSTIICIREECDRNTCYYLDPCKGPKRIHEMSSGIMCFWNDAKKLELAPHASVIETISFSSNISAKRCRVGFNFIPLEIFNKESLHRSPNGEMVPGWEFKKVKNIIWSDTIEVK
ncbi:MAG: hypothetical protein JWO03_3825 [Bacteroidetes bacterium]|nr:hypothetical protein [Bacteroidota bacterium]